jgi:hypothetical protein
MIMMPPLPSPPPNDKRTFLQSAAICIPNPGLKFDNIYYESNQIVLLGPEPFQSAHMAHALKFTYIHRLTLKVLLN